MSEGWEYQDFVYPLNITWTSGVNYPTFQIANSVWYEHQKQIMMAIRKWLDDGWEPLTEIGPAAINVEVGKPKMSLSDAILLLGATQHDVKVVDFRVKMRRRKI